MLSLADPKTSAINFWNTIIIFTSNIWQKELNKNSIWFNAWNKQINKENNSATLSWIINQYFPPEFASRIGDSDIIEFTKLDHDELKQIIDIEIGVLEKDINKKYILYPNITITLQDSVYDYILKKWYNEKKWARDLIRGFEEIIKEKIYLLMHSNHFNNNENIEWNIILDFFFKDDVLYLEFILENKKRNITYKKIKQKPKIEWEHSWIIKVETKWIFGFNDLINKIWINSSDIAVSVKNNALYIVDKWYLLNNFNEVNTLVDNYNKISLNWKNLELLWIKASKISKLIYNLLLKYDWDQHDSSVKLYLLVELRIILESYVYKNTKINKSDLINELIYIIDRQLKKYKD
jgi:hypothetical protein